MLLSRSVYENSNMDGSLNPAATENNYVLLYGDFAAGMVIVDRIGSTLELVPHLFGSNRRPTGQRGALLWFRTGSDVVIPNAFRPLSIPTTAQQDDRGTRCPRATARTPTGDRSNLCRSTWGSAALPQPRRFAVRAVAEPHSGSGSRPRVAGWPEGRREPAGWRLDTSGPEPGSDPWVGP
jgi:hypothetical protein